MKRFVIEHLDDRKLVARAILLALHEKRVVRADLPGFARLLFAATDLRGFFEHLLAYLLLTGARSIDETWVGNGERVRAIYPAMAAWLRLTFVERRPTPPPVGGTSGMVFVSMLLDTVEAHLLSVRAFDAARVVSETRCRLDRAFSGREPFWLLESGFVAHVGHLVYASVLLQHQASVRLPGPEIRINDGESSNPYLRSKLARHMIRTGTVAVRYVEMISARKRFLLDDGRMATMSELVSEAARVWASGRPFDSLDDETRARGDATLASLGVPVGSPIATLHVREAGYHAGAASVMRLRDARIEDYGAAIDELAARGIWVVRLGDSSMQQARRRSGFVDYPFTAAKSDWMDVYLAARCRFHIGTSSGMSFVPLLFGRPVLFTNWVTLAHMVCAPSVLTVPKVLLDREGRVVPMAVYCDRHREILESSDAVLHGLSFRDNSPEELRDAAIFLDEAIDRGHGMPRFEDGTFADSQAVFRASPLGTDPQIPPASWRIHWNGL